MGNFQDIWNEEQIQKTNNALTEANKFLYKESLQKDIKCLSEEQIQKINNALKETNKLL